MENTEILAIYGTNYKEMTKKLLEEGNMAERIPDKECRIGIKPNPGISFRTLLGSHYTSGNCGRNY